MPRDSRPARGSSIALGQLKFGGLLLLAQLWKLLHFFFAFSFVGSLVVAEWNGRAARVTQDWGQRALLFHIVHLSSRVAGLGSLVLAGVFGNLASLRLGYSMAS